MYSTRMATAPTVLPTIPEVEHEQSEYVILETPLTLPTSYNGYGYIPDLATIQSTRYVVRPYRWYHMLFCALLPGLAAYLGYLLWVAVKA